MSCNIKTIKTCEIFSDSIFARNFSFDEALQKVTAKIQKSDSANVQNIELTKISNMFSLEIEPLNLAVGNYKITYIFEILISGKLIRKTGLIENLSILKIGCNCEKSENENLDFSIELNQTVIDVKLNFSVLNIGSISESGKSAFDIAVENGFVGTEIEWLLSLKGDKGEKGDKGDAFTYADFTPTQIAELQKPATDKVVELNELEVILNNSESLRVQNENTRVSSENTRNTNEQTRINAENNRISAETSRVSAENTRTTNEQSRVSAENTRVSAENSRVTAENTRVSNESGRVTAESARVAAELARQQNKAFNVKITTPSSYVTGTMSETQVLRIEIPANSISDNSFLNIPILFISKIGTNGAMSIRGKLSTSPTMPSGTTDMIFGYTNLSATNITLGMDRTYIIADGLIKGFPFALSPLTSSAAGTVSFASKPLDRTVTNYLYVSILLANSADQARLEGMQLTNS